jgi:hypothetical protein
MLDASAVALKAGHIIPPFGFQVQLAAALTKFTLSHLFAPISRE